MLDLAVKLTLVLLPDAETVACWMSVERADPICVYSSGAVETGAKVSPGIFEAEPSDNGSPVAVLRSGQDAEQLAGCPYAICYASDDPSAYTIAVGFNNRPESTPPWLPYLLQVLGESVTRERAASRVFEFESDERIRIAEDIHGDIGGLITALQFSLKLGQLDSGSSSPSALQESLELVDKLSAVSRQTTGRVYPLELTRFGLGSALRVQVARAADKSARPIELNVQIPDDHRFPHAIESAAYRLITAWIESVCENTSQSSTAAIVVRMDASILQVSLTGCAPGGDIASGEPARAPVSTAHTDRVRLMGGHVNTARNPDGTYVLQASIPFPPAST